MKNRGISVIICCYNSGWIIEKCIKSLIYQKGIDKSEYEIIIVDNCCSDNTIQLATNILKKTYLTYQILHEPIPGLMNARKTGIRHSNYNLILFCDDDNILSPHYLSTCINIMSDTTIGACGGYGIGIAVNSSLPIWFNDHAGAYACYSKNYGDRLTTHLFGAGICIREEIFSRLERLKFNYLLVGRKGKTLLAGDDTELCYCIRILGYKLKQIGSLTFEHNLPTNRLNEIYLNKIKYGFGKSYAITATYQGIIRKKSFIYIYTRIILGSIYAFIKSILYRNNKSFNKGIYKSLFLFSPIIIYKKYKELKSIAINK